MRILQQGHWVDESYQEWPNTYDVSTPELAAKFAVPLFAVYIKRLYPKGLPKREYTLADYNAQYVWRDDDFSKSNFAAQVKKHEKEFDELTEAIEAFKRNDGEALLEFLRNNADDDPRLNFKVITVKEEFVVPEFDEEDDDDE